MQLALTGECLHGRHKCTYPIHIRFIYRPETDLRISKSMCFFSCWQVRRPYYNSNDSHSCCHYNTSIPQYYKSTARMHGTDTILSVLSFVRTMWANAIHTPLSTQYLNIFGLLAFIYISAFKGVFFLLKELSFKPNSHCSQLDLEYKWKQ